MVGLILSKWYIQTYVKEESRKMKSQFFVQFQMNNYKTENWQQYSSFFYFHGQHLIGD